MNEPKTNTELEAAVAEATANGQDIDPSQLAAAAGRIQQPTPVQAPLDPNRPMWHLVTPSTMQDLVELLKAMPYEKVHRILPALIQAPIHQQPPPG